MGVQAGQKDPHAHVVFENSNPNLVWHMLGLLSCGKTMTTKTLYKTIEEDSV